MARERKAERRTEGKEAPLFFLAKHYVCNQWQKWVISPQLHEDIHNKCFWSTLEELHEKHGVGLQLHAFSGVEVSGAGRDWHEKLMELLEFLDYTSSVLSTDCTVEFYMTRQTKLEIFFMLKNKESEPTVPGEEGKIRSL